jgi:hypothetical protein
MGAVLLFPQVFFFFFFFFKFECGCVDYGYGLIFEYGLIIDGCGCVDLWTMDYLNMV